MGALTRFDVMLSVVHMQIKIEGGQNSHVSREGIEGQAYCKFSKEVFSGQNASIYRVRCQFYDVTAKRPLDHLATQQTAVFGARKGHFTIWSFIAYLAHGSIYV